MKTHCPIITKFSPSGKRRSYTWCLWRNDDGSFCNNDCWTRKEIGSSRCSRHLNRTKRKKKEERVTMVTMKQKKISEMTEAELREAKYIMNLKGKDYCTVAYRLLRFREEHKGWAIEKNIVHRDEKSIIIKCTIKNEHGQIISEDFAEEFCSTRLPTIEKASTDAMGRALANLGYATASIASYEEMQRFESRNTTPRPKPTSAIPQQPRATRVLPQPQTQVPQASHEEIEKELRAETKWMNDPLPWAIDTDQGKRKFTWQELFDVNTITKDGEEYTCRRYLRTLAGACKENNAMLSAKATITADLIKKQEEDLEKSVIDPISITKAFILTMPNKGSWNGKWSQEGELFAVVKNVPSCKPKDGTYHYSWGDGWGANVEVKTVTKKEAKEIEKKSKGFCGYEWMIDSLIAHGEILSDKEKEEKLSSQDSLFPEKEEQHQYNEEGVGA